MAIGRTLRSWRDEKGFSLREIEEASRKMPEPLTFEYLSRLERGQLMPSLPKLCSLAEVYGRQISELVDLYEIEQFRGLVPKRGSYDLLRKLGIQGLEKGEVTKALACFLGALDAAKRDQAPQQTLAVAYNNVGGALIRACRYLLARNYLEEGLRWVESDHTRARLFDNLAIVHYHLDNLPLAELISRESMRLAAEDDALKTMTRATRAAILLDLKRLVEAEELLREVIEEHQGSGNDPEEIRHRYNLGHCLVEQGQVEPGLEQLRTAAAKAAETGDPDLRAKSLFFFGRCLYKIGRIEEAAGPLTSSLRLSRQHNIRNESFHSAYYLWLLARLRQELTEEARLYEVVRQHRTWLQQRSEEGAAFDEYVSKRGTGARRRKRASSLAADNS
jgi:tetratricopeptide (TPR) repeat protein